MAVDTEENSLRLETLPLLIPSYDDPSRRSSVQSTVFALVATMLGGSVLSLPWAIAQAGLVPGIFALMLWALVSDFTAFILLRCARRGGFTSYEDVAAAAFGPWMRIMVGGFTLLLCWMVTSGYLILAGDMALHTYEAVWGGTGTQARASMWAKALVAIIVLPASLATSLHSLRFTCLLSLTTILLLALLLVYKAASQWTALSAPAVASTPSASPRLYQLWPGSLSDFLYTFSLFSGGYVCHFNVLAAHGELTFPTRGRVQSALRLTMLGCFVVYTSIAVAGYVFTGQTACDNVLLNFCPKDALASVSHSGMLVIILANLPLIVFPARKALDGLMAAFSGPQGSRRAGDVELLTGSLSARLWNTMIILSTATAFAIAAPGVHVVWTLLAGTVSMAVAYVLPPLMFLQLQKGTDWDWHKSGCALVLGFSVAVSILTTYQTVAKLGKSSTCPSGFNPCTLSP